MATRFKLKRSSTLGVVPVAGTGVNQLDVGEMAVNTADEKLFIVNSSGTVISFLSTNKQTAVAAGPSVAGRVFLMMGG